MERINVRVDRQVKQELESEARARGVRASDIVREAIDAHLGRRAAAATAGELARRLGLVGVYTDTPADLSTNPAHLDGFGRG